MFFSEQPTAVKAAIVALAIFLVALVINYCLYAGAIAYDLPEGDHWRWLRVGLIPLLEGEKNFWQYLTVEFVPLSHSHIPTLFQVWLNYHLFGLDYRLESWLGLFGMLAFFAVLCRSYWRMPGNAVPVVVRLAVIACFALVMLNQRNILSWTLVQFENLYFLATLGYLILADRYFAGQVSRLTMLGVTLLVFFLGEAVGIAAILAVLGYILVFAPKREARLLFAIIALVIVCTLLSIILIRGINPLVLLQGRGGSGPGLAGYVLANLLDFIKTVLMLFAQALGGTQEFRYYGGDTWLLARYIVGLGVAGFMAVAALAWFVYRERLVATSLPMLLILLSLASLAGIILTRFRSFGLDIADANRYIRLFQAGLVGALWINSALLVKLYRDLPVRPLVWLAGSACVAILAGCFVLESYYYWRFVDNILANRENMANAFRQYAVDDATPVGDYHARCSNHYCREAIAFLRENRLSLFSE